MLPADHSRNCSQNVLLLQIELRHDFEMKCRPATHPLVVLEGATFLRSHHPLRVIQRATDARLGRAQNRKERARSTLFHRLPMLPDMGFAKVAFGD